MTKKNLSQKYKNGLKRKKVVKSEMRRKHILERKGWKITCMNISVDLEKVLDETRCPDIAQYIGLPSGSDGKESACNAETWVQSLGREDPLKEEMAAHCSILTWGIP